MEGLTQLGYLVGDEGGRMGDGLFFSLVLFKDAVLVNQP